jgi:hypothetical protein
MRDSIHCARLLAFVTGLVNQELLLQNEFLAAENRILRAHLPTRLRLSNGGEVHTGGDRQTARAEGAERGCSYCETGHHPGMVPAAYCPQV